MEITDNLKLELFTELSEYFPEKANQIIAKAENICNSDSGFLTLNDEKKVEAIMNKIFSDSSLIDQEIYFVLELNKYINNFNPQEITFEFINEINDLNRHPFFNKNSVNNSSIENNFDELKSLVDIISQYIEKTSQLSILINNEIKKQIDFILKLNFLKIELQLKENLLKINQQTLLQQKELSDISKDILIKYKDVQTHIDKIHLNNQSAFSNHHLDKIKAEIKNILSEENKLINKAEEFQILPIDRMLEFPELLDSFSSLVRSYPIITGLIKSAEINNSDYQLNIFKNIENKFFENIDTFIEKSKKSFERGLLDPKDKNKTFKSKFIEPIKDKFSTEDYLKITDFIDTIF